MPDILVTRDKSKQKADEACLYYKLGACKAVINNLASKQKKQQNNLVDAPFSSVKLFPTPVLRAQNSAWPATDSQCCTAGEGVD